jgi:hypothetical protein
MTKSHHTGPMSNRTFFSFVQSASSTAVADTDLAKFYGTHRLQTRTHHPGTRCLKIPRSTSQGRLVKHLEERSGRARSDSKGSQLTSFSDGRRFPTHSTGARRRELWCHGLAERKAVGILVLSGPLKLEMETPFTNVFSPSIALATRVTTTINAIWKPS